jgi:hypothetical protein
MASPGMDDQSRWLVDHHELRVLEDDSHLDIGLGNEDVRANRRE